MSIEKAKALIARHDKNAERIRELRIALRILSPENEYAHVAHCDLVVQQGTVRECPTIAVSKDLARPLFEAELAKVERDQSEVTELLAALQ